MFRNSNNRENILGFILPWIGIIAAGMLLASISLLAAFDNGVISGIIGVLLWVVVMILYIYAYRKSRDRWRHRA
jgi:lipopolysaccharide export LptBFGC system permease protein LptF